MPLPPSIPSLALAVVTSSSAPLLLLNGEFRVVAASKSFCLDFGLDSASVPNNLIYQLGNGEWNMPKLRSLLSATANGVAAIDAYELKFAGAGGAPRHLVLNAKRLDHSEEVWILLAISDVTEARAKDDLLREKTILLEELQHRVANSLQIIASVLMQSAKRVQSDEARYHLRAAHSRVMSVAEVQRQLTASQLGDVSLRKYLNQLAWSIQASMIPDPDRIALAVAVDGSIVTADTSVSIGLVVTELIINSLKHAFPGDGRGRIDVTYARNGEGWALTVADNGIGMPKVRGEVGLGTNIVEALAKRLDASIHIVSGAPGTRTSLVHGSGRRSGARDDSELYKVT